MVVDDVNKKAKCSINNRYGLLCIRPCRFRDEASLEAWENSEELHKLTEEANKYSTPYLQKATGLETWFTLPDLKAIVPPPK